MVSHPSHLRAPPLPLEWSWRVLRFVCQWRESRWFAPLLTHALAVPTLVVKSGTCVLLVYTLADEPNALGPWPLLSLTL